MHIETASKPAAARHSLAGRVEHAIGRFAELAAGILVLVETAILFAGVVSRYVIHRPFTWSDELASILFLWLAMLGAVVAYRRSEHMRMSALVDGAGPRIKSILNALALVAGLAFLMLVMGPALEYAHDEIMIVTPALEIPNVWRAAALPVGFALMIILGLLRIGRTSTPADCAIAAAIVVGLGVLLYLSKPMLMAIGNYRLLVFFVLLVGAAVLGGVPIAFAFGLGTFAHLALTTRSPLTIVVSRMDEGMSHIILLSVPLFVFLGLLIEITGLARGMVDFLASLIGHLRGGLRYVLLGAMYLVSGISGSKAADMAAVAPVLFPEMKKRGAKGGDLVALLSASGAMSETIPPSLVLITIGSVCNVSIAALFTGGLLPALVLALALCVVVWWRSRTEDLTGVTRASPRVIAMCAVIAAPGIALPFLIRAAVVEGVATATEVSTIGIAYTLAIGVAYWLLRKGSPAAERRLDPVRWDRMWQVLVETAALSGAILLIIGAATAMAWALTQSGFSRELAAAMSKLPGGAAGFMAVSLVAFVILGSVLEGIPAIVLFGPLLFPIARQLGIHDVHYAMVVILAMGVGLFAPPFGVGYYAACAIGRVDPAEGIRPIWPYLIALIIGTIVVAAVPWISIGFL
jgi:tripartite ATP-independent transporter DctM subunit